MGIGCGAVNLEAGVKRDDVVEGGGRGATGRLEGEGGAERSQV